MRRFLLPTRVRSMIQPLRSARLLLALALLAPASALGADVGHTSFYPTASGQQSKVKTLQSLGYTVAVPLNLSAFTDPAKLGDGGFNQADLDFTSAVPATPGTAQRVTFESPLGPAGRPLRLYAVVAGVPMEGSCPIAVKKTKIMFSSNPDESSQQAELLAKEGYLVYVTINKAVQQAAAQALMKLNCKGDASGVVVNGQTQGVSIDFSRVYALLPAALQQAAKAGSFDYAPAKGSTYIFLVNARKQTP